MGIWDALRQYINDASPGGALNPEMPKDTPVLGLLAHPLDSIRSTLNKANAQADAHLKKLDAASREMARTKSVRGPAQDAYTNEVGNWMLNTFGPLQTVWHGSPYKFDKFDFSKAGTGEGNASYGAGGYLAEAQQVGKKYQEAVSKARDAGTRLENSSGSVELPSWLGSEIEANGIDSAIAEWTKRAAESRAAMANSSQPWLHEERAQRFESQLEQMMAIKNSGGANVNRGYLYKVDLPDEHIGKMLDLDKPMSQQTPEVRVAITKLARENPEVMDALQKNGMGDMSGQSLYATLQDIYTKNNKSAAIRSGSDASKWTQKDIENFAAGNDRFASDTLNKYGIVGNKYLDELSRNAGYGTSNFVVFPGNEGLLTILERNGQPLK